MVTCIQGGSKLCFSNIKAGRGDLNKQISYRNVDAESLHWGNRMCWWVWQFDNLKHHYLYEFPATCTIALMWSLPKCIMYDAVQENGLHPIHLLLLSILSKDYPLSHIILLPPLQKFWTSVLIMPWSIKWSIYAHVPMETLHGNLADF